MLLIAVFNLPFNLLLAPAQQIEYSDDFNEKICGGGCIGGSSNEIYSR